MKMTASAVAGLFSASTEDFDFDSKLGLSQ